MKAGEHSHTAADAGDVGPGGYGDQWVPTRERGTGRRCFRFPNIRRQGWSLSLTGGGRDKFAYLWPLTEGERGGRRMWWQIQKAVEHIKAASPHKRSGQAVTEGERAV